MPNRASLAMQARVLGLDPDTIPNDSVLHERVLYLQQKAGAVTGALAAQTLTSNATTPTNGDTVTIGSITYTFRTTLGTAPVVPFEVLIGGSAANALINLKKAINNTGVVATDYSSGTTLHPEVSAGAITATTLVVTALYKAIGNQIATTETAVTLSWGNTTLLTGLPGIVAGKAVDVAAVSGGSAL